MQQFITASATSCCACSAAPRPIVAAINGHAIAGGCVLALQCDWRVMVDAPEARIGLNETQLGIGLPTSVLEPLKLAVPPASLVPIAYEGRLFAPEEALRARPRARALPGERARGAGDGAGARAGGGAVDGGGAGEAGAATGGARGDRAPRGRGDRALARHLVLAERRASACRRRWPSCVADGAGVAYASTGAAPTLRVLARGARLAARRGATFPSAVARATGTGGDHLQPRRVRALADAAARLAGRLHARGGGGARRRPRRRGRAADPRRTLRRRVDCAALRGRAAGARARILEAPHVFVEDKTVASIAALRGLPGAGRRGSGAITPMRARPSTRWTSVWLDPAFRAWNIEACLPSVRAPALVIQGEDDEYGTVAQVEAVARAARRPVRDAALARVRPLAAPRSAGAHARRDGRLRRARRALNL